MKVDVLQAGDINFGKFRWWSNWIDIAIFEHDINPHLIQMRINRVNGKKFRTINMMGYKSWKNCRINEIGDLTQMTNT